MSNVSNEVQEQENVYSIWGLSKLAVRNIVVFFILSLLSAIGYLSKTIIDKDSALDKCHTLHVSSMEKHAVKIEELMRRQIDLVSTQSEILKTQRKIRNEIKKKSQ